MKAWLKNFAFALPLPHQRVLRAFCCVVIAGFFPPAIHATTIVIDPIVGDTPPFLQLLGINNAGAIVGYTGSGVVNPNNGVFFTPPSTFTSFNPNLSNGMQTFTNAQTQIFGITGSGNTTVGFVIDTNGVTHGFVDVGDGPTATAVDNPLTTSTPAVNQLLGVNQAGTEAAGFYTNSMGVDFGYTYNIGTPGFTDLTLPASLGFSAGDNVMATGVNNSDLVTGFFMAGANSFGFLFNPALMTYTPIDVPGASSTQPLSINDLGQIVGTYVGADGLNHGFIFSNGAYTTFDAVPGAPMNLIQGINDNGQIVGFVLTNAETMQTEGFFASTPEPSGLMLCAGGIVALLAARFRQRGSRNRQS